MSEEMKSPACREQAGPSTDLSTGAEQANKMYTDNNQKATGWLRALVPSGPINIVTANVEKFGATVKTRTFTDNAAMQDWIVAEEERGRDVWFQVNECTDRDYREERTGKDGSKYMANIRPSKPDVTFIRGVHLDFDFKDLHPEVTDPALRKEMEAEALDRILAGKWIGKDGGDLPPTAVNNSGGGYHVFWQYAEPVPKTEESVVRTEAICRHIIDKLKAGGGTQDVSRLLRVAHTTNFKPGRERRTVTPVERNGPRYKPDDFGTPKAEKLPLDKKTTDLTTVGDALPVADLSKLGLTVAKDHDTIALIVWSPPTYEPTPYGPAGYGFERPPELYNEERQYLFDDGERSERVLSVVSRLANRKVPVEMICGVLLNPDWGVSAHVLDQTDPIAYAKHQCRKIEQPVVTGKLISLAPIPLDLQPPPILVPNWLMDGKVSFLGGRGGAGKSTLALALMLSIALGIPLLKFRPKERRKVLILETEDGIDILRYRLWALCQEYGIDDRELEGWLFTLPLTSLELVAKTETEDGTKYVRTPLYESVMEYVREYDIGVLLLDPFAETFENCDENSNSDMLKVIVEHRKALAEIDRPLSLLLCHHTRKGYAQEGSEQDAFRGAGALINACRYAQLVEPIPPTERTALAGAGTDRRFVRVSDAKRNYEREEDKLILEFKEYQHPTGFKVPAFVIPDLTVIDPNLEIDVWPGLEKTLAEVRSRYTTRPFRIGSSGKREGRLDAWIQDTFGLNKDDTELVVKKMFQESKVLGQGSWKDPSDRKFKQVVIVAGDDLPAAIEELPF